MGMATIQHWLETRNVLISVSVLLPEVVETATKPSSLSLQKYSLGTPSVCSRRTSVGGGISLRRAIPYLGKVKVRSHRIRCVASRHGAAPYGTAASVVRRTAPYYAGSCAKKAASHGAGPCRAGFRAKEPILVCPVGCGDMKGSCVRDVVSSAVSRRPRRQRWKSIDRRPHSADVAAGRRARSPSRPVSARRPVGPARTSVIHSVVGPLWVD